MKPKYIRLLRYLIYLGLVVSGVLLILKFTWNELSFYKTPTQVRKGSFVGKSLRLGGYVKKGSIAKAGNALRFVVYDSHTEILVMYQGPVPQLFREGQGVVLDGKLDPQGAFKATRVLAKHDEVYTSKKRTLEPKL